MQRYIKFFLFISVLLGKMQKSRFCMVFGCLNIKKKNQPPIKEGWVKRMSCFSINRNQLASTVFEKLNFKRS